MPKFQSQHFIKQKKDFLFDLVADIESYPQFLPACLDAKITERRGDNLIANLTIGYGPLHEVFISDVKLDRTKGTILATLKEGKLKNLYCLWEFIEQEGGTNITCTLEFEFRSRLLKAVATPLLDHAARRLMESFIERAQSLTLKQP